VAKDSATLKTYNHSIDLQLTDLYNNQCQAGAAGNNLFLASYTFSGFCDPNAIDINAKNIDFHFQELSNENIIKKWHK
jgi:hypothetical protein